MPIYQCLIQAMAAIGSTMKIRVPNENPRLPYIIKGA